ncbi:uncharacterized protein PV06_07747 [Exophiala oligosperma]|uniref:Glycosyl hydrolase family 32 N-terminal domain-containing protein n=1 Tax=Exophiala oligosperma TaxID=215243 RepID=A0A0D2AKJ0_9EURO|nr:uncharacterized protein PV06_07747 [Exophiala oligosperma]KIW40561.1 hypothetical protein PV06_07747 [Exophiala oligosperma]
MKDLIRAFQLLVLFISSTFAYRLSEEAQLPFEINRHTLEGDPGFIAPIFPILPFHKYSQNPILTPNVKNDWESAYVYNPTAMVLNETVFLLYRAQNASKTSAIGLAWASDGYNFTRLNRPIFSATEDWEMGGGTEDPRIVRVNGTFYLTYTAFDLQTPRLCISTSEDLLTWTKYPPLFMTSHDVVGGAAGMDHTKSGAIVTEPTADGFYHMYFGDSVFYHATSTDLLNWTTSKVPFAAPVYPWENGLIEPGPAPVKTRDGRWLLIYNAMTTGEGGYRATQYSVGQMLLNPASEVEHDSPSFIVPDSMHRNGHSHNLIVSQGKAQQISQAAQNRLLCDEGAQKTQKGYQHPVARLETPFLVPSTPEEEEGQVDLVVFAEGLVQFKGKWFLYYGQADQTVGVAVADVQP